MHHCCFPSHWHAQIRTAAANSKPPIHHHHCHLVVHVRCYLSHLWIPIGKAVGSFVTAFINQGSCVLATDFLHQPLTLRLARDRGPVDCEPALY